MKKFGNLLIAFLCLITLVFCSFAEIRAGRTKRSVKISAVVPPVSLVKSGDIILRDGNSFISDVMRDFSQKDKRYSHAGIIHIEAGNIFVYHILPAEKGHSSFMLKEPIALFCNDLDNNSYAIYRTKADGVAVDRKAGLLYQSHPQFDTQFSLSTDDKLYCTELVYKVFLSASNGEK
ncbi:MAG: hypothetical protein IPP51_08935 [Bacteroidetes bacterium]|nr:hypothetical protein [Bacteroidota bacterium]